MKPTFAEPSNADSEDDEDYIPPAGEDPESSDDEPDTKRVRTASPQQDDPTKKQNRDALWSTFQASLTTPGSSHSCEPRKEMIKVEKRYRFAGVDTVEVVEVAVDSAEAQKWPVWHGTEKGDTAQTIALDPSQEVEATNEMISASGSSTPPAPVRPFAKRPGPRKSRIDLTAPPTGKAKKLSTLDKSAMDWRVHIQAEGDSGLKDELEANRRTGGYIEKVEFLQRVDARKADAFEANKGSKRRRV